MKKTYIPPLVYAESFQLSHHIAACEGNKVKLNSANLGVCGGTISDESDPVYNAKFFASDGFCGENEDDEYLEAEGYCYTNHTNTVGYFGS